MRDKYECAYRKSEHARNAIVDYFHGEYIHVIHGTVLRENKIRIQFSAMIVVAFGMK